MGSNASLPAIGDATLPVGRSAFVPDHLAPDVR